MLGEEVIVTADEVTGESNVEVAREAAREASGEVADSKATFVVEAAVADDSEDTEHVGGEGEDDPGDIIGKFDKLLTVEMN